MSRKIRELAIPKYKKDWPGKTLLMKEDCPTTHWRAGKHDQPSRLSAGEVVTLERFLSRDEARMSGWGELYRWTEEGQRVLRAGEFLDEIERRLAEGGHDGTA